MSREVRRVPIDYKHPTEPNPFWRPHYFSHLERTGRGYRLHDKTERFVSMMEHETFVSIMEDFAKQREQVENRSGHHWNFPVEYHITGFKRPDEDVYKIHPFYVYDDHDGENPIEVKDEDHLQELLLKNINEEEANFKESEHTDFMPDFSDVPEDKMGYCLYQTVSEGAPVTPVFATKEELVDYLVEYGTEWDQPLRREAAENIVNTGYTMGSFVAVGNTMYDSTADADKLSKLGDKND